MNINYNYSLLANAIIKQANKDKKKMLSYGKEVKYFFESDYYKHLIKPLADFAVKFETKDLVNYIELKLL